MVKKTVDSLGRTGSLSWGFICDAYFFWPRYTVYVTVVKSQSTSVGYSSITNIWY